MEQEGKMVKSKTVFALHGLAGICLGVFFFLLSFSGAVLVFRPELERAFFPEQVYVSAQQGETHGANAVAKAIKESQPDFLVGRLYLPKGLDQLYQSLLVSKKDINHHRWVTVDPYTLQVKETETTWLSVLVDLHHHLLMPHYLGTTVLFVLSIIYLLTSLTGAYIRKDFWKSFWQVKWRKNFTGNLRVLHSLVGHWSIPFHLLMITTSLVITFATVAYGPMGPDMLAKLPKGDVDYERLAEVAKAKYDLPIKHMQLAPEAVTVFMVKGERVEDEQFANFIKLSYDPASFALKNETGANKDPLVWQALNACTAFHFGRFGGMTIKVAYVLFGLFGAFLSLSGTLIYIFRRRDKSVPSFSNQLKPVEGTMSFGRLCWKGIQWSGLLMLVALGVGLVIGLLNPSPVRSSLFLMVHVAFGIQLIFIFLLLLWPINWLLRLKRSGKTGIMRLSLTMLFGGFFASILLESVLLWAGKALGWV